MAGKENAFPAFSCMYKTVLKIQQKEPDAIDRTGLFPLPWHNSAYAAMQAKRMIKIMDSTAVRGLISFTLPVHSFSRV